ncbi:TfuA-like protein [Streptomyces sp. ME02-6987-2C]|uniref:TfuA-like protein n=1 Tax=unclassified Streptomyces TaxID=2593676 RepID=UPI0029BAF320|nr:MULTISPECIES: TfuA-like protein [unclassified Streptomyces]MDX3345853.1 TfuA-like protein [Streptomyces sp. ME02-6979A]MDX3367256.1 TfuA-like protein [Streptomyces sp. ME02-6987-2C]MDX3404897.1 TfuA-like protein [Streptomyces sp. ME02-6977A]MDX3421619.1 TfuA-like protein [Streptomyces sp. ME02-6985-2c]
MTIHVFTGPTLSPEDPALQGPAVRPRPPIRHGDLFDPQIAAGDTVVIIDGVYHHAPALRHKEIIWALGRGVRVIGAASIGALRAAELAECGMIGVGSVWSDYVSGQLDGDDEVAVAQSTNGDLRSCTWPLVRVRKVASLGALVRVLLPAEAHRLVHDLADVYYAHRSLDAVMEISRRQGRYAFAAWLAQELAANPHFCDVKREDALKAITTAREMADAPVEAAQGLAWQTRCFRQWVNAFATKSTDHGRLSTLRRVNYQQIFDPDYKDVWWDHVSGFGVHGLPRAVACRVVNTGLDLTDETTTALLLAHETPDDRASVGHYARVNEQARQEQPEFFPEAIKEDAVRDMLTTAWRTTADDLEEEAWQRGLHGVREAVEVARPFVLGFIREVEAAR